MSGGKRRLAGILAADVVGYSAMVAADEPAGLARVRRLRTEIVEPAAAAHDGRLFKSMGDGFLLEFASAVQALQCAITIQSTLNAQTDGLRLRIGVHQGEVVPEGDDLLGDGVIVAARLEPLAEPGGIVISSRVKEDASGKMTLEVDDLGEPALKHIAAKIRAYRVRLGAPAAAASQPALALPDKPSIAVLPFQNMSGDPEQEYFADGMVEEITTAIARLPWLFVIARNSSFTYKGKAIDVKQVARELGVRYVLEGSVRKGGNRVRITGQLIDTATGAHIWADRFDGALDDIFDLQDRVASAVAGAIEPKLRLSEIERAARKPTESLGAYDLYLRALPQSYSYSDASFAAAVALLRQALAIDPDYAPAAALLGFCRTQQQAQGWGALADADLAESVRLARQALKASRDDAETLWQTAWVLFRFAGETALAQAVLDRAVTLNPNVAMAWVAKGWVHALRNQPKPAIAALDRGLRLSPFDPVGYYFSTGLAYAHLAARGFEDAIAWADRALHDQPRYIHPNRIKIAALAHLGRLDEARTELARVLVIDPRLSIAGFRAAYAPSMAPEIIELVAAGLRLTGLPEDDAR